LLCARLKSIDRVWLPRLAARVWLEAVGQGRFTSALGPRVVLVPVPGSSALPGSDRVAERLAWCLQQLGLAAQVWPVLRRRYAVRKSAFAAAGERPSVLEHYASFAVERAARDVASMSRARSSGDRCATVLRLTLIDDVITRGRTLLAAAARVREAFPLAQIRAFALVRTLRSDEILRRVLDPCEGEVYWISRDARRRP
jgi:predicted amidophosphoribosyltransferase